jgi:hypothetical protein
MTPTSPRTSGDPADRRVDALRKAAQDKRNQAIQRAEKGIRQLLKDGKEINFRTVARAAGVSLDFLYSHPDLRTRIQTLRAQATNTASAKREDEPPGEGTVIHTLTQSLRRERIARREEVHDLEQKLAAAHGEILRLRRTLQGHGIAH